MHGSGPMGNHPGVHPGVSISANGQHILLEQPMDNDYYHD